jgi:hypothetical protein
VEVTDGNDIHSHSNVIFLGKGGANPNGTTFLG